MVLRVRELPVPRPSPLKNANLPRISLFPKSQLTRKRPTVRAPPTDTPTTPPAYSSEGPAPRSPRAPFRAGAGWRKWVEPRPAAEPGAGGRRGGPSHRPFRRRRPTPPPTPTQRAAGTPSLPGPRGRVPGVGGEGGGRRRLITGARWSRRFAVPRGPRAERALD